MTTVAFLYNVRHHYPDPNDPKTQLEADFDDPPTIERIIIHLKECGYHVIPIEANEQAYFKLFEHKKEIDIAFNFAEGIHGRDREAQLPAMLEMLQIPYTGSSPLTHGLVLHKAKTKEILMNYDIPTAPFQVFTTGDEPLNKTLSFPLMVKPVSEGSSAGITNDSIVHDETHLRRQLKELMTLFHEQILVEPFIPGREFSVGLLGNPPKVLPIIEADHSKLPSKYQPIDSLEVKWFFEEEADSHHLICPAKIDDTLKQKVEEICLAAWQALDILDWCRMDIRCDKEGNPFFLEVNSPVGLLPPEISTTSYFPLACRTLGMNYNQMLQEIINIALKRYSK